ncbi:LapA family protein [Thioalkalivibrio thiocyanoxidans]|uniref:LapA family protein n=1 Tax=Thioalkalivibrio thiocyanoxidans TaxID=152475 RepID=UPI00035C3C5E|nr:LapA family protein [Thioalkalivibrio thiocyanoxidans]
MSDRRRQQVRNVLAFVLLIVISSAIGILVVFNEGHVTLSLPWTDVQAPLVVLLGISALVGVVITASIFWVRIRRLNQKVADLRAENRALQTEVEQMRTAPMRDFY